jgi:ornithine cyclodeaminase
VDNWAYVSRRVPELARLLGDGRLTRDMLHAEWPEVVAGRVPGRETDDERITYVALGIWGEYAAILPAVYHRTLERGLGQMVDLSGAP